MNLLSSKLNRTWVLAGVACSVAVLAGCGVSGYNDCQSFLSIECLQGVAPGPITLTPAPKRHPVVTLSDDRDAQILFSGREGDDSQNPVQKFVRSFNLENGVLGPTLPLAGSTPQNFVSSVRPDLSGRNDSLVSDASGQAAALWIAINAGVIELYSNSYLSGFGARELMATPGANLNGHRIAMNGRGGVGIVWAVSDGTVRARDRIGNSGFGAEAILPVTPQTLGDARFAGSQLMVVSTTGSGEVYATVGLGPTWSTPVRIGTARPETPVRLASHPDAPRVVAIWESEVGLESNTWTASGWLSNNGTAIPGSEGARVPQIVMGANGETMVVWRLSDIYASRRDTGSWSAPELIGSGSAPRLAGDAAGNAIAVWSRGTTVRANRFVAGVGWQGEKEVGGDFVGGSPDVAMDESGRGVVVWERVIPATPDPLDTEVAAVAFGRPVARFTMAPNPVAVGAPVTFDGSGSSASFGALANYQWDFNRDGVFDATGVTTQMSFSTEGERSVRLRVTDAAGLRSDTTQSLSVTSVTRSLGLQVIGTGGRVTGPNGIDCRAGGVGTCQGTFLQGSGVTLTAASDAGWQFDGWTGDCSGGTATLSFTLVNNRNCIATFTAIPIPTLTVTVIGNGTVTSNPAGITCGADCSEPYPLGTVVALTATPAAGYNFSAWSGDADCTDGSVTMTAARGCTATFTATPPPPAIGVQRMSTSIATSYAVDAAGVPYSWGTDGTGQLGNGAPTADVLVATPMGTLAAVRTIESGPSFGVAARTDGTVWVWGYRGSTICNFSGASDLVPVQIVGATNAVALSGGGSHTLILRDDGTVQAFGCGNVGQLGRSSTAPSASAIPVAGLTGVTAVAAGNLLSLALRSDGTVWSWGMGALGDGTMGSRFAPTQIPGLTNVIAIAAGNDHALALRSDGSVWAWGSNTNGKLGDGTVVNRLTPVATLLTSQITAIAAAAEFSLALRSDGVVMSWGINTTGQLGSGSLAPGFRPQPGAVAGLTGAVAIATGSFDVGHALALRSDGTAWSWGQNDHGQLGNGTTGPSAFSATPVQVTGLNLN